MSSDVSSHHIDKEIVEKGVKLLINLNTKNPVEYRKDCLQIFHELLPDGFRPLGKQIPIGVLTEIFSVAFFQLTEHQRGNISLTAFSPFLDLFDLIFTVCPNLIARAFNLALPSHLKDILHKNARTIETDVVQSVARTILALAADTTFATELVNQFCVDRHLAYLVIPLIIRDEPQLDSILIALRTISQLYGKTHARQINSAHAAGLFEHVLSFEGIRGYRHFDELARELFRFISTVGMSSLPPPIIDAFFALAEDLSWASRIDVFTCLSKLHARNFSLVERRMFQHVLTALAEPYHPDVVRLYKAISEALYTEASLSRTAVFEDVYPHLSIVVSHLDAHAVDAQCRLYASFFSALIDDETPSVYNPPSSADAFPSCLVDSDVPSEELLGYLAFDDRVAPRAPPPQTVSPISVSSGSQDSPSNSFSQVSEFSMSFRHLARVQAAGGAQACASEPTQQLRRVEPFTPSIHSKLSCLSDSAMPADRQAETPSLSTDLLEMPPRCVEIFERDIVAPLFARLKELDLPPCCPEYNTFLNLLSAVFRNCEAFGATEVPAFGIEILRRQLAAEPLALTISSIEFISSALLLPDAHTLFFTDDYSIISRTLIDKVGAESFLLSDLFRGLSRAMDKNVQIATSLLTNYVIIPFFEVPHIPHCGRNFLNSLLKLKGIAPFLVREPYVKRFLLGPELAVHVTEGDTSDERAFLAAVPERTLYEYFQFMASATSHPSGAVPAAGDRLVLLGIKHSLSAELSATPSTVTAISLQGSNSSTLPEISSTILRQLSVIPSLHATLIASGAMDAAAGFLQRAAGSTRAKTDVMQTFLNIVQNSLKKVCHAFNPLAAVFRDLLAMRDPMFAAPSITVLCLLTEDHGELAFIVEHFDQFVGPFLESCKLGLWGDLTREDTLLLFQRVLGSAPDKRTIAALERCGMLSALLKFPLRTKCSPAELGAFLGLLRPFVPVGAKLITTGAVVPRKLVKLILLDADRDEPFAFRELALRTFADLLHEETALVVKVLLDADAGSVASVCAAIGVIADQAGPGAVQELCIYLMDKLSEVRAARSPMLESAVRAMFTTMHVHGPYKLRRTRKAEKRLRSRFKLKDKEHN